MGTTLLLCAMLGQAGSDLQPIPSMTALVEAHKLIEDVYGRRIEAAKTPAQKAAVGQEILAIAEKEQNQANRYAGLQVAKKLAIEAENGKVGLAVVERFAAEFQPTLPREPDAWLPAAEKAWEAAESEKGSERLAGRLDAAECWLRAGEEVQAGFAGAKWKGRLAELEGDGTAVAAKADDAKPVDARTLKLLRAINGKTVIIVNKKSGLELHVSGGSGEPGATVTQWEPSREHTNGNWVVEVIDGRWCRFRNAISGFWLGRREGSRSGVADSAIQSKITDEGNDWELQLADDSSVIFRHRHDGLCLGPWKGWVRRGCGIHLYPFSENDPSLRWQFKAAR